jgi:hypothetical protein
MRMSHGIEHAHTQLLGHRCEPRRGMQSGTRVWDPLLPPLFHRNAADIADFAHSLDPCRRSNNEVDFDLSHVSTRRVAPMLQRFQPERQRDPVCAAARHVFERLGCGARDRPKQYLLSSPYLVPYDPLTWLIAQPPFCAEQNGKGTEHANHHRVIRLTVRARFRSQTAGLYRRPA